MALNIEHKKEKYDNLYKFYKDNEEKYQYTGFTKEAINKDAKMSDIKNEYFLYHLLVKKLKRIS